MIGKRELGRTKLWHLCRGLMEAGWVAALVTSPLFFNVHSARPFEPNKVALVRSIALVVGFAWVVMIAERGWQGCSESARSRRSAASSWLRRPLVVSVLLLLLSYVVSTVLSLSPGISLWGSYPRLQGTFSVLSYVLIFASVAANLRTHDQVGRLVTTAIVTSIPVGLFAIAQRWGLDTVLFTTDPRRIGSTLGTPTFLGAYLTLILPLTLARLIGAVVEDAGRAEESQYRQSMSLTVFGLAATLQVLGIAFSQSRGSMLGALTGVFFMGLLVLLLLRQARGCSSSLSLKELGSGILFVVPLLLLGAAGGGIGYAVGRVLESLPSPLSYEVQGSSVAMAIGASLGLFGGLTHVVVTGRGTRWAWISWLCMGAGALFLVLALNIRGTVLDALLDPLREAPYASRLARITETERGTGRVRLLVWEAVGRLVAPHEPLGIAGDEVAKPDALNAVRPLFGYGPESMFNAFASVHPPELAHLEARESSADRAHNETLDSLLTLGLAGLVASYLVMASVFYQLLSWLGFTPNEGSRRRLLGLLVSFCLLGGLIAFTSAEQLTFVPLGLSFGLVAAVLAHMVGQGLASQDESSGQADVSLRLLGIGLLAGLVGHFIQLQFLFFVAATHTYFWIYAGLVAALCRMKCQTPPLEFPEVVPQSRACGVGMAIVLGVMTYSFLTPGYEAEVPGTDGINLPWMFLVTWGGGAVITQAGRRSNAFLSYTICSVGLAIAYFVAHRVHLGRRPSVASLTSAEGALRAADGLSGGLVLFYSFLLLAMITYALVLSPRDARGLPFSSFRFAWLPVILVVAVGSTIWFKNVNVVRADMYSREGNKYVPAQWETVLALHEKARSLDPDEDHHYLTLASDYQRMVQDTRLDSSRRCVLSRRGKEAALRARQLNPYNPDNTVNLARYYLTLGEYVDRTRLDDALAFFERATILAPTNVTYHNLWAQALHAMEDYLAEIERLEVSLGIDPRYPPTWLLLGDAYMAMGRVESALRPHKEAMQLVVRGSDGFAAFCDSSFDRRLDFYVSKGRRHDLVTAMRETLERRPRIEAERWAPFIEEAEGRALKTD